MTQMANVALDTSCTRAFLWVRAQRLAGFGRRSVGDVPGRRSYAVGGGGRHSGQPRVQMKNYAQTGCVALGVLWLTDRRQ
jgi:hypothetical protein